MRGPSVRSFGALPPAGPPPVRSPVAQEHRESGPWAPRRRCAPRCAAGPAPAAHTARPDRPAATPTRHLPRRTAGRMPGEEGASVAVAPRTRSCAPPPRPLPSSDLLRCGAGTRQGPWRSTAARASRQRAVVALFAAERHWRVQHPS